ncbi:hypothetical protein [Actinoplanes sp. NPDC049802]|uniref:hypothetical protein n=1 Tax=Actinoplanes sp. NPDC049802 TaxID=3154742 RepID=UPI0033EB6222
MTITPPRGTGGTTTRSVRSRNRRRQNAATDPRHAAGQPELSPPRRRAGRHAAAEPEAPAPHPAETGTAAPHGDGSGHPDPTAGSFLDGAAGGAAHAGEGRRIGGPHADGSFAAGGASLPDPESPAPAWDPWAAAGNGLPAASITDPMEGSGIVDGRAFWSGPAPTAAPSGPAPTAVPSGPDTGWDGFPAGTADGIGAVPPGEAWDEPDSAEGEGHWGRGDAVKTWAPTAGNGTTSGWDPAIRAGDHPTGSWTWPPVDDAAPEIWAGTGTTHTPGETGTGSKAWTGATRAPGEADAGLAVRAEGGSTHSAGEADAGSGGRSAASSDEAGAREAYRGRGVEEHRKEGRRRSGRGTHGRRARSGYLSAAVIRCGLYLGPLSAAVAGAESLGRVAWPVPAVMLLLGWTAAQGLTCVGVSVARRGGPGAAARIVGAGFAGVIGLWFALVWIAPDALLGPDRALAATVGLGGLLTLGSVTTALVTRAEGVVAGWFMPCWLLAAATMAGSAGVAQAALVPVETLLPAAIVAVTVRAFQPAVLGGHAFRAAGGTARMSRLGAAERRRCVAYLVIGAAQATSVALLWRGGPAVMPVPAALPLLVAVPLLEALIGWHTARLDAGLDSAETPEEFDRHVRNVTAITLAGLVPPLAAGCGLLLAAFRLPYGFSGVPGARDAVLALAAGTLLGGVFAVTFLLAARSRHGIAAVLATIPPLAAAVLALSAPPAGLLPAAVAVLAATHLAGLLIVALTAADLRRTP